jgi:transposase
MSKSRGGPKGYPPEFRARAVELYRSSGLAMSRVAADLGIANRSLKMWVQQAEIDSGERDGLISTEH